MTIITSSRDKKLLLHLLISLGIHAAIVALIFDLSSSTEIKSIPVEFQLQSGTSKAKSKSASKIRSNPQQRKAFVLGHSIKPDFSNLEEIENRIKNKSARWDSRDSYLTNEIGYSDLTARQIHFSSTVWTEINDAIVDSPLLAEYGQTGDVFMQFEINQFGELIQDSILVKAENKVLQVFAMRSLRKAIRKDNLDLKAPEKHTRIAAHFRWTPGTPCSGLQGNYSNYLSFCRVSSVERRNFSGTEKASVYLGSLIYGPGAIEEIDKYHKQENRRKTGFDPFQEIKRDPDWNLGS